MRSFEARVHIDAEPQRVWDRQLRLADWALWDPKIVEAVGNLGQRGEVTLHIRRPGESKIRKFKLRVTEWVPPHRLVLAGGMPFGLFTGTQTHLSNANLGGGTDFVVRQSFTGPFARLFKIPDLQPGFDMFAEGLKAAVAAGAEGPQPV